MKYFIFRAICSQKVHNAVIWNKFSNWSQNETLLRIFLSELCAIHNHTVNSCLEIQNATQPFKPVLWYLHLLVTLTNLLWHLILNSFISAVIQWQFPLISTPTIHVFCKIINMNIVCNTMFKCIIQNSDIYVKWI